VAASNIKATPPDKAICILFMIHSHKPVQDRKRFMIAPVPHASRNSGTLKRGAGFPVGVFRKGFFQC
jgi:hypothetical protein